jgi:hypothetical protein
VKVSVLSYSFRGLLNAGTMDVFGYLETCKFGPFSVPSRASLAAIPTARVRILWYHGRTKTKIGIG